MPPDAQFVASSRGKVYYWIGCNAWKQLSASDLRFFKTQQEAVAAGYTPSQREGCAGPADPPAITSFAELEPAPSDEFNRSGRIGRFCIVKRIIDGDTFDCSNGNRVRLLLIDAPEMDQGPFGTVAKEALEKLAPPGTLVELELDVQERDRYGRVLAYVRNEAVMLNEEMARLGYAVQLTYPPNVKYVEVIRGAAEKARAEKRGLWAAGAFDCTPADHRAGRCGR